MYGHEGASGFCAMVKWVLSCAVVKFNKFCLCLGNEKTKWKNRQSY